MAKGHGSALGCYHDRAAVKCDECRAHVRMLNRRAAERRRAQGVKRKRYDKPKPRPNACKRCGEPARADADYCSKRCARTVRPRAIVLHPNPVHPRVADAERRLGAETEGPRRLFASGPCNRCGETFAAVTYNAEAVPRYCSKRCAKNEGRARYRRTEAGREASRHDRRKRDARLVGRRYERWTRAEVWSITDGVCGLLLSDDCPVRLDPGDWHVDHFLPLALGGADELANLLPACPACNLAKGARHPSELEVNERVLLRAIGPSPMTPKPLAA